MTKSETIKQMYADLKSGFTLDIDGGKIWLGESYNKPDYGQKYFYWRYFGQSANKPTLSNLWWIINHIFDGKIDYQKE